MRKQNRTCARWLAPLLLLLLAVLPWHAARAGTATVVNNSGSSITCPFSALCTITPAPCNSGSTCSVSGPGFALLQANPSGTNVIWNGTVAGCTNNLVSDHCNPDLGPGGGTITVSPVRTVTLTQSSTSLNEGATPTNTYTATLNATSGSTVTVNLQFSGAASFPSDYSRSGTSITIPAGSLSGTSTITVINDTADEPDESLVVDISSLANALENGTQQVTATINDNDNPPTVSLGLTGSPLTETGGVGTVTATLSAASGFPITVNLAYTGTAASPADYSAPASILIAAGATSGTANITSASDTIDEPNETVIVDITTVTNASEQGNQSVTATINDDDPAPVVTLSLAGSPFPETGGIAIVTATLANASSSAVTVNLGFSGTAANPTDYTRSATSITVPAGSLTGSITLNSVGDPVDELDETVIVDITSVTNGTESGTQQVTATITDDDAAPTVTLSGGAAFAENGGTSAVTATLSAVSSLSVTVNLGFSGTATNISDYTRSGISIVIGPGATTGSITLTGVNDTIDEPAESVIVDVTGVTNGTESGTQQVTANINDDDPAPVATIGGAGSVSEGGTLNYTVTLDRQSSSNLTINLTYGGTATGGGTDYSGNVATLIINALSTTGTVSLVTVNDGFYEGNETATVTVGAGTGYTLGGTLTGTGTLLETSPIPQAIINFIATPAAPTYSPGGTFAVSATGGGSGNPVVFASTSAGVCTVAGTTVSIVTAGTCALTANQAGNGSYAAAPQVTLNVTIAKAAQTITNVQATPAAPMYVSGGAGTFTMSATPGASTSPVVYSVTTPAICSTTAGGTVTMSGAGTCSLLVNQAADTNYNAAPTVPFNVTIAQAAQAITNFIATPAAPTFAPGGTFALSATPGDSTSPVSFAATTPAICSVAGSTVTMLGAGTCSLTADQAGDANYTAAPQVPLDVTIAQSAQAITNFIATPAAPTFAPGGTFAVSATAGASTSPVTFAVTTPAICSIAGSTVTMLGAGTCSLTADQAGDANYLDAPQVPLDVTIAQAAQAITNFIATPAAPTFAPGGTFSVSATAGASTSPVTFATTTPAICSVSGSTVTMLGAGTCSLTADQAADANYLAAQQVPLDVIIAQAAQSITNFIATPAAPTFAPGGTFALSATPGASTSPVTFATSTPAICSVAGSTVTMLGAGTCSLTADQAGDVNYTAAPQVPLDVIIAQAAQAITNFIATPAAPTFTPGGTFAVSATAGASTSPVTFAVTTPAICSIAGTTVTMLGAGTCSLTADQAGDANYLDAPQVPLDVTIAQSAQAITNFIATPAAPTFAPGGTFAVSATAGASTSPVTFAVTTPAICSIAGSTVTMLGAGTCSLTADQAGDANYLDAPQVPLDVTIAQAAQAITNFIATPAAPTFAPGGTFSVSATAGASTSPVTFAVTTPAICSVSGSTVTMLGAGTCSLTADQAADANYLAAQQVPLDVIIAQAAQSITNFIATPAAPTFAPGGTFALSATPGASTSPVTFATSTPAICSVAGSTVTMLGAGTCSLTADQAGDVNYTAAPQVPLDVIIAQAAQAITNFIATPAAPTFTPGGTFAVSATAGASTSPVTFAVTTPAICSIAGTTVTMLGAGTCSLTADQAGDANYLDAPQVPLDVTIAQAAQAITNFIATPAAPTFTPGGTFSVSATAGASTSPVLFATTTPAMCSVSGSTVTMLGAGTCSLTADQAGDANYLDAPQVPLDVTIAQAAQAITNFIATPAAPTFAPGGTFSVSATAGASTSPVTFAVTTPAICSVSGSTVTMLGAGTCSLTADQAGDANYTAAPQVPLAVTIGLASQAITNFIATPAAPTFVTGGTFSVSATAGASTSPVLFASTTPAVCTVSGSTVTMLAAGSCSLTADQAGDANYTAAAQVPLAVTIGLGTQAITNFIATPAVPTFVPGGTFSVSATAGASTSPVVFAGTTPAVCTVSGSTVTMLSAGNCSLTADQAGDANYTAAPQVTLVVGIGLASQAITNFIATPAAPTYAPAGTFALSATPGASTSPVVFASTTPATCSVAGSTVTMLGAGTCSLTADQAGDTNYAAAPQVTLDVTIGPAAQAITGFAATPAAPIFVPGGTFTVSATPGASTSPVVFAGTTPAVCTVSGGTVTMVSAGTCSLTADQAADANYTAAPQVTLDVTIGLGTQAITNFVATPAAPTFSPGGTFNVSATAGASTGPILFAGTTPAVCTVSGNTVTMLSAGTCSLTADQAGDANYNAAPQVTLDVTIALGTQAITNFVATPAAPTFVPGGTFSVSATAGASASPVLFASTTPAVCTVSGSTITMLSAGTCSLTADQAGDANYNAAPQVTLDVTIGLGTQAITNFVATPAAPTFVPGGTFSVSATAGASTSPVVFAGTTPAVCTVSGSTVTMLSAGTCSLTADQAGDANYNAAPQVTLDVTIGLGTQAITNFVATPAAPTFVPGGTFSVSATAGASTSPVLFAGTAPAVCTVSGNTVTMLSAGTCSLTADQAGDANYNAAPQVTLDVTIALGTQAITNFVATPAAPTFVPGGTFSVSATAGASTSPVVFAGTTPAVCTVSGSTVTMLSAGTCSLTANQAGDANYSAAPQVTLDVAIGLGTQAITNFVATPAAPTFAPGGTFMVSATAGASTSPVVFAGTTPAVCTVSGSTITMLSAGTCSLTADQAGDANYSAAPQVTLDVAIGLGTQAITNFVATPAAPTFAPGGTFMVSATAGASTSPVVFAGTTPAVCTVSGSTITMLSAGTCSLTADQAGDANYTAAPQVTLDVAIGQATQAITGFIATPAAPTFAPGGTFSVSATGGASSNPVVFGSTAPAVCTVSGSTVTMLGAGTCSLTADQAGDANYGAAPQVTLDVAIGQATQAITGFIATPAAPTFAPGGTFTVSATGGASTSPVVFASTTPAVCTLSGSMVTMLGAGTCSLTADQAGDANYTAAPQVTLDVVIGQATQAITSFVAIPATPTFTPGGTFNVSATAGASTSPVVFGGTTPTICTVSGNTVTMLSAGTCSLTADQAGDANYSAAPQLTLDVAIGQAAQAITNFVATPATPTFAPGGTFTVSATGGASTSPVTFAGTTPAVCTVSGNTVTMLGAGTCSLTADQAGDANYTAAPQVTLDVAIGQATQAITGFIATPAAPTFAPGGTFSVSATGGASSNPVVFGSTAPAVCTVSGSTVTMLGAGTCSLTADQAGDANYGAAPQVTLDVAIGQATQAITGFIATPAAPTFAPGGTFTVSATGGASTSPVVFASTTPAVCTLSGSMVTMLGAGTCSLTADQAGDANYTAAPQVTLDVVIGQATQAITSFVAIPATPTFTPGGTFNVSATAGASTSPVVFGGTTPTICTVSGNTVTMLSAGTCSLTADQAGDANYSAAPQLTLDVAIGQAAQAITSFVATPATPTFAPGGTFTVSATGGASSNPVVFASTTPTVCTVSGSTVTMLSAGTCSLTADQAGDAAYAAAPQVLLDVAIGQAAQAITGFATTPAVPAFVPGGTFTVSATGGASTSPVVFGSTTPAVCAVSGNTVTMLIPGICTLTANQAGDANYTAAPQVTLDVSLLSIPPTLEWIDDQQRTIGEAPFDLPDPSSNSTGAFTFTSSDPTVATVSGRTVTLVGPGVTTLTATQAPSGNFVAGSVSALLTVSDRPDPTTDRDVAGGVQAQVDASVRFAEGQLDNIHGRLQQLRGNNGNPSANGVALNVLGGNGGSLPLAASQFGSGGTASLPEGWGFWTGGNITLGQRDDHGAADGFDFRSDGITVGVDRRVGENTVLGVAGGIGWVDTEFDDSTSEVDADHRSFAAYGLWRGHSNWFVDAVIGWGRLDFDIARESAVAGATASARRDGDQTFGALTLGYDHRGERMGLTGYLRYDASHTRLDAYSESGLGIYDLAYGEQDIDNTTLAIGLEGRYRIQASSGEFSPFWTVEYRDALTDSSDVDINYVVQPVSTDYTLGLRTYNDNVFALGAGVDITLSRGWTLSFLLRHQQSSEARDASFGLRMSYNARAMHDPQRDAADHKLQAIDPVTGEELPR